MTVPSFLTDIIRRLLAKTPLFFRIWQAIGLLATIIVKLPDYIPSVPAAVEPYKTIIEVAGIVITIGAQLTVADTSIRKASINTK